jgi:hypothetical protein
MRVKKIKNGNLHINDVFRRCIEINYPLAEGRLELMAVSPEQSGVPPNPLDEFKVILIHYQIF